MAVAARKPTKKRIGLGIIGCGWVTSDMHLPALHELRGEIEVVALCDVVPDRLEQTARFLGWDKNRSRHTNRAFKDYRSLVKCRDVDAVLVATPNDSHETIVAAALKASKHVLAEKPLALTLSAHARLGSLARQRRRVLQIGLVYRYAPIFHEAVQRVHAGRIGKPHMIFLHDFRPFSPSSWVYDPKISGGLFAHMSCHHFDLCNWFVGDGVAPRRVFAVGGQAVLKSGKPKMVAAVGGRRLIIRDSQIPDHAWVNIEYTNGAEAVLGVALLCRQNEGLHVGIFGDGGRLDIWPQSAQLWPRFGAACTPSRT